MSNSTFYQPPSPIPGHSRPRSGPDFDGAPPASFFPRASTSDPNLNENADDPVLEPPPEGNDHDSSQELQLLDGIAMDLDRPMIVNIHLKILDAAFTRHCTIIPDSGLDPLTYSSKLPAGLSLRQAENDTRPSCSCDCQCKSRGDIHQREREREPLGHASNNSDHDSLQSDETPRSTAGVGVGVHSPPSVVMTLWNLHGPPPSSPGSGQALLDPLLREALPWYIRATERIKCILALSIAPIPTGMPAVIASCDALQDSLSSVVSAVNMLANADINHSNESLERPSSGDVDKLLGLLGRLGRYFIDLVQHLDSRDVQSISISHEQRNLRCYAKSFESIAGRMKDSVDLS